VSGKAKIKDTTSEEVYCTQVFLMTIKYQMSGKAKFKDSASVFLGGLYTALPNAS
jgi:hypothetical protein